jgi:hypothetical protein
MYLIRLTYAPQAGVTGDAALGAAREFNRSWVGLGMPQMRVLLSPFGPFGAPFVQMDVTVEDLAEAEAALTRLRASLDSQQSASAPAPTVEILRIVDDPPIDEEQVRKALYAAMPPATTAPTANIEDETLRAAEARAQDVGAE